MWFKSDASLMAHGPSHSPHHSCPSATPPNKYIVGLGFQECGSDFALCLAISGRYQAFDADICRTRTITGSIGLVVLEPGSHIPCKAM